MKGECPQLTEAREHHQYLRRGALQRIGAFPFGFEELQRSSRAEEALADGRHAVIASISRASTAHAAH